MRFLLTMRGAKLYQTYQSDALWWDRPSRGHIISPASRCIIGYNFLQMFIALGGVPAMQVIEGRSCGTCSICCKVMQVDELEKPQGVWCRHCTPGRGGCSIHATRPAVCRDFFCGWLISSALGAEWQPSTCKMLINFETNRLRLTIHVDPGHLSTPEQKCIGQPEQKYITEPARRPPNWGLFLQSSGLGGIIRRRVRASPT